MTKVDDIFSRKRPLVMGILNVTPDSFSDGGMFSDATVALDHAQKMLEEGAAIIDVGAESTRPGSERISVEEQFSRLEPLLSKLCAMTHQAGALLSIDTTQAAVAELALSAGANIINDVSAGRDDPAIFSLAAERKAPIVLMHMLGEPKSMQHEPHYGDVVSEVKAFLLERVDQAISAGVSREQCIIDPGIGFGKTLEHNLALLEGISQLAQTGLPVLLGPSRKRFIGELTRQPDPQKRLGGTIAACLEAYRRGGRIFRVHDVLPVRQALELAVSLNAH